MPSVSIPQTLSGQWVVLRLGRREFGLPVSAVVEVLRMVALTALPEAPWALAGVVNLRGRVLSVMDLRKRLDVEASPAGLDENIVVVDVGGRWLGLLADAATEVLDLPTDAIEPPDQLAGANHPIAGIARTAGRLVLLFDLERLTAGMEVVSLPEIEHAAGNAQPE